MKRAAATASCKKRAAASSRERAAASSKGRASASAAGSGELGIRFRVKDDIRCAGLIYIKNPRKRQLSPRIGQPVVKRSGDEWRTVNSDRTITCRHIE